MPAAGRQRLLWWIWACALSVSCGSTPTASGPTTLEEKFRQLGIDPATFVQPLEVTPEMREWAWSQVRQGASEKQRMYDLMEGLSRKDGLAVRYQRDRTGTAREVFETGLANCLSFTHLFIALAREVGVDVYFLKVARDERYAREGDLVVRWEHVTAGWGPAQNRTVLEFGFIPDQDSYLGASEIPDLTAIAMFHSNRGAEALIAGDKQEALEWLETAVVLDPGWSHSWLNLGVVRRRLGDLEGAEAAYRRGIEANPEHLQLYSNLATLLRLRGERDSAGVLLRLLDRKRNRNPFSYLMLGDTALREQRLDDAGRFYRRAMRLNRNNANTRAAMGLWELASDRPDKARGWLERAERLDAEAERVVLLRSRLAKTEEPAEPANEEDVESETRSPQRRS